jgi:hypothetical protein
MRIREQLDSWARAHIGQCVCDVCLGSEIGVEPTDRKFEAGNWPVDGKQDTFVQPLPGKMRQLWHPSHGLLSQRLAWV